MMEMKLKKSILKKFLSHKLLNLENLLEKLN